MPYWAEKSTLKLQSRVVVGVTEKGFVPESVTIWEGASVVFQIRGEQKLYFDSRPRQHVLCMEEGDGF